VCNYGDDCVESVGEFVISRSLEVLMKAGQVPDRVFIDRVIIEILY